MWWPHSWCHPHRRVAVHNLSTETSHFSNWKRKTLVCCTNYRKSTLIHVKKVICRLFIRIPETNWPHSDLCVTASWCCEYTLFVCFQLTKQRTKIGSGLRMISNRADLCFSSFISSFLKNIIIIYAFLYNSKTNCWTQQWEWHKKRQREIETTAECVHMSLRTGGFNKQTQHACCFWHSEVVNKGTLNTEALQEWWIYQDNRKSVGVRGSERETPSQREREPTGLHCTCPRMQPSLPSTCSFGPKVFRDQPDLSRCNTSNTRA